MSERRSKNPPEKVLARFVEIVENGEIPDRPLLSDIAKLARQALDHDGRITLGRRIGRPPKQFGPFDIACQVIRARPNFDSYQAAARSISSETGLKPSTVLQYYKTHRKLAHGLLEVGFDWDEFVRQTARLKSYWQELRDLLLEFRSHDRTRLFDRSTADHFIGRLPASKFPRIINEMHRLGLRRNREALESIFGTEYVRKFLRD